MYGDVRQVISPPMCPPHVPFGRERHRCEGPEVLLVLADLVELVMERIEQLPGAPGPDQNVVVIEEPEPDRSCEHRDDQHDQQDPPIALDERHVAAFIPGG